MSSTLALLAAASPLPRAEDPHRFHSVATTMTSTSDVVVDRAKARATTSPALGGDQLSFVCLKTERIPGLREGR